MTKLVDFAVISKPPPGGVTSQVHNTETLRHFSGSHAWKNERKSSFLNAHNRWRNLTLANNLQKTSLASDPVIQTTEKNLCNCSKNAVVGVTAANEAHIYRLSHSCKNQHCAICARRKAAKYAHRLHCAIADKENREFFENKYWYHLTLTLRHAEGVRDYVYLDELNGYITRLFRCKLWKSLTDGGGSLTHIENSLRPDGYHIHSHSLLCINPLKIPIMEMQKKIAEKWLKITGDSDIVALDLVKGIRMGGYNSDGGVKSDATGLVGAVMELFKYSTKTGAVGFISPDGYEKLARFIVETKGKKFVRASGFFKGMQITSLTSKYDAVKLQDEQPKPEYERYYFGSTSKLWFSSNPKRDYSTKKRRKVLEKVYLSRFKDFRDTIEITGFRDLAPDTLGWLLSSRYEEFDFAEWLALNSEVDVNDSGDIAGIKITDEARQRMAEMDRQQRLFDTTIDHWTTEGW